MAKKPGVDLDRLKELRHDAHMNQTQVAELLGTSQTVYSRYERGAVEMPVRHLVKLCTIFKVSADYLLGFTRIPCPYRKK